MDASWTAKADGIPFIEIHRTDGALRCRDIGKSRTRLPVRFAINLVSSGRELVSLAAASVVIARSYGPLLWPCRPPNGWNVQAGFGRGRVSSGCWLINEEHWRSQWHPARRFEVRYR